MSADETHAFSRRLREALTRVIGRVPAATELATQFNLRHPNEPVTPQATHKWLTGRAMPTADKCLTLSEWLDVPLHWLRHGPAEPDNGKHGGKTRQITTQGSVPLSADERRGLASFRDLPPRRRQLLLEILAELAPEEKIDGPV